MAKTPGPSIFAAAASKAGAPKAAGKKSEKNYFQVTDPVVAKAIDDFVAANGQVKLAETNKEVAGGVVAPFCRGEFLKDFAEKGSQPETLKFRTPAENVVTFVVQDRGEKYNVSEELITTLQSLLGEEVAESIILRDMTFAFDNDVLGQSGVMEALGSKIGELTTASLTVNGFITIPLADAKITINGVVGDASGLAVGMAVIVKGKADAPEISATTAPTKTTKAVPETIDAARLVSGRITGVNLPTLSDDAAGRLLKATPRTTIKKGTLEKLAQLCGNDCDLMDTVMAALGTHIVAYVKS